MAQDRGGHAFVSGAGTTTRGSGGAVFVPVKGKGKKKGSHGVLGLVENLGHDVADAVVGLPAGIVQTARHPIGTAKEIGKSYAATYGPLAHGDVSKFLHTLYSHPLGPILDVATIVTGGAGGIAKAGKVAADAGLITRTGRFANLGERAELTYRSPRAVAGGKGPVATRLSHTNPVVKARQKAIKKMLDKLPYETPHIGEAARYAREAQRLPRQAAMRLTRSKEANAYNRAVRGLDNEELAALHLIGNDFHPTDYAAALKKLQAQGEHVEPSMFKVLENPKVIDKFENPDAKMTAAIDAAEALTRLDATIKEQHGILDAGTAAARVGKHRPAVEDLVGALRPTPGRPFYVPDVPHARRVANPELAKMGSGAGVAKNIVKQNRGVLFRTGQLALTPDILGPEFLRTIKYGLADDLHATMMESAARVSAEEARAGLIPKGYEFVPKEIIGKHGGKRGKPIHPLVRGKRAAVEAVEDTLPAEERILESFTVKDLRDAAQIHGDYLIVPTTLKRELVGEFHRSQSSVRKFIEAPTKVWRALVLGFRPGFLTNNLVGNHLLYALHAAGPDGLRAYLNAIKREKGKGVVRSLIEDGSLPPALRDQFMRDFFPEQIEGTFGGTQMPGASKRLRGKKGRKVRGATVGLLPATQAVAETNLRRALVETMIRKSPEFKKVYRAMPRQARDFEAAANKVLKGTGGHEYQALISRQVNDALGDYLNLNPFERNVIRAAFPFYSWYRAITTITTHLALDTPGRADLLTKIGDVGVEETKKTLGEIPDYLKGLLPIGQAKDGKQEVLTTGGLNPFGTVTQLGSGAAGLLTGHPGDTGRALSQLGPNPLLMAAIENLAGKDLFTGRDLTGGSGGLLGAVARNVATELPQARLLSRPETKLYGKPSPRQAVLQFLGAPVRTLDVNQAQRYARR
jgi:hypothetical protein